MDTPYAIVAQYNRGRIKRELCIEQLKERKDQVTKAKNYIEVVEEAQVTLQTAAQETQQQLRYHIEDLVQTAMDTIFPGKYTFCVDFELKRGKTEASMYVEQGVAKMNPMDSNGGGLADIIALGLRMACWTLSKTDNLLIMDEPYKNLSAGYRPLMGEILKTLSRKLGLQVITVTHDQEITSIADRIFRLTQRQGKTIVAIEGGNTGIC